VNKENKQPFGSDKDDLELVDFGDFVLIEQKRFGVPNEKYLYKVINRLYSNGYVDTPVQAGSKETLHSESVEVVSCICCGVMETEVLKFRRVAVVKASQ
jgi:hypothetical protein